MKTRIFLLITLLCAAVASLQSIHANTITVTNTNDSGAGSLRAALVSAVDGDTINFDVAVTGTITLTSGQLLVNKSVTISGPSASNLSVDGNHATRVFYISRGKTVTISGLTIANGNGYAAGGGIWNEHAALTVSECAISGNSAESGGGIFNNGNYFYSGSATMTVSNCTFSGNSAVWGSAIFNDGESGSATLTVNNTTFSGNSASIAGGGVYNYGLSGSATMTVNNCTFSGNSAQYGGGVDNLGPDMWGRYGSATLTVNNTTFSGNSASVAGGGVFNDGGRYATATVTMGNTILNAGSSGENIYNASGTITSVGYNLSSDDASALLNQAGDLNSTDPMLGPLQDNGGPTFTHQVFCGSPAIDAGDPSFSPPPDYDQRGLGFIRVVNGRIDIGAFEVQTPPVCPQPQGYWKSNPDLWPVNSLTLGSQTYTKTELLNILTTRATGDASLILAYQLIAAKLNIANCANGTPATSTIIDADAVLSLYSGMLPYRVRPNSTNGQRMVSDGAVLGNYNNGLLTPGCTPTPTPTPSPTP